jgi:2,3-bisphosphoglycerate-dependent phosphoglycerate mutase
MASGSAYDLSADPRYAGVEVPRTESLKLTIERVLPYWEGEILPVLARGETVIVSAHGNSLRALVKHLSGISDDDITGLEIPTGEPIVYDFDERMEPGERHYLKDR